jgi:hypothetical protein
VDEIKDPLTQQVRYLDNLVNELAKGRIMEMILRTELDEWELKINKN